MQVTLSHIDPRKYFRGASPGPQQCCEGSWGYGHEGGGGGWKQLFGLPSFTFAGVTFEDGMLN